MNKKILVPLGQNDRTEELISYIEKVARPGMTVVFLMRYPVGGIKWPTKEPDTETASDVKELLDYHSSEGNLQRAEQKVASRCAALRTKGVEVAVDVYAGSLKTAVRSHTLNGAVHLIMTRRTSRSNRLSAEKKLTAETRRTPSKDFLETLRISPNSVSSGQTDFGYFTAEALRGRRGS